MADTTQETIKVTRLASSKAKVTKTLKDAKKHPNTKWALNTCRGVVIAAAGQMIAQSATQNLSRRVPKA